MRQRFQPRVTVAAIIERAGRFLLIEEETSEGLRLNNPAGHLDPGEAPAEGCARETLEETAHHFTPTALVGVYLSRSTRLDGEDVTYMRLAFCGDPHGPPPRIGGHLERPVVGHPPGGQASCTSFEGDVRSPADEQDLGPDLGPCGIRPGDRHGQQTEEENLFQD